LNSWFVFLLTVGRLLATVGQVNKFRVDRLTDRLKKC